jgi:hypothetical protein
MGSTEQLSVRVTRALAELEGCDPAHLTPPLGTVVDPEAIDALPTWGDAVEVTFEYDGHEVMVEGTGEVRVDGHRFPA